MNTQLINTYKQFRAAQLGGIVGQDAQNCLFRAKTLIAFRELEAAGKVRIRQEAETESYWDVYGDICDFSEKQVKDINESIEQLGCWWVTSEVYDGCECCDRGEWEHADSVGMHTGYHNPCSPFENCYVIDMMDAAIKAYNNQSKNIAA